MTKKNQIEQTLWFSGAGQVKKLAVSHFYLERDRVCKVSEKQKLYIIEGTSGGSFSWSYCFYVKQGKCNSVKNAGENLSHISGRNFIIYPSAYDAQKDRTLSGLMTGHTWKAYYLKWTGSKFAIYAGNVLSLKTLKKYTGASKYLKQIQSAGYKIGKIYLRKNGIININLYKEQKFFIQYENVTLKKNGSHVTLVVHNRTGGNIVEESSYGGIYQSKTKI